MHRRILASAAAAALTFGLAACGDGSDGPVTTPPPDIGINAPSDGGGDDPSDGGASASSDGGGDPTAAAPDIPAPDPADYPGMDQNTPEGAEQAFRYYWALTTWGMQTGDSSKLRELRTDNCSRCNETITQIEGYASAGEYWSPVSIEDQLLETKQGDRHDTVVSYAFIVSAHSEPGKNPGERIEEGTMIYSIVGGMVWDGGWKIDDAGMHIEPLEGDE